MLKVEKLYRSLEHTVQVFAPGISINDPKTFLWTGEFNFGGQAEFSTPYETERVNTIKQLSQQAGQAISELGALSGSSVLQNLGQRGYLQSLNSTVAIFSGYSKPTIQVEVFDFSFSQKVNPKQRLIQLLKAVYPEEATNITVSKPFDYTPVLLKPEESKGLVGLRVSKFFNVSSFLIIREVQLSFSNEITPYGFPLWGKASITFEPYKLPTYKEVESWFT